MLEGNGAGFRTGVEDGRGGTGVGAECHAFVVELCAGVKFVDAWLEGGFPDLETDFCGEEGEEGEGRGGAFEWVGESLSGFEESVVVEG